MSRLAAGAGDSPLLLAAITGLFSLFAGGTIVALIRVRADKNRVVVDASQGAVIVQSGVIKDIRDELTRVQEELLHEREKFVRAEIAHAAEIRKCSNAIDDLKAQVSDLITQIRSLGANPDV